MKLREALIAWSQGGKVEIRRITENSAKWTDGYERTSGAAFAAIQNVSDADAPGAAFVLFAYLVCGGHGLNPVQVHNEFLHIDEFADAALAGTSNLFSAYRRVIDPEGDMA